MRPALTNLLGLAISAAIVLAIFIASLDVVCSQSGVCL